MVPIEFLHVCFLSLILLLPIGTRIDLCYFTILSTSVSFNKNLIIFTQSSVKQTVSVIHDVYNIQN